MIGKFIAQLPPGQLFVTRELLTFGLRKRVDSVMHDLVKSGRLIHLAPAVFVRNDLGMSMPPLEEIVAARARAHGRTANLLGRSLAIQFNIEPKPTRPIQNKRNRSDSEKDTEQIVATFATLGNTTSFWTIYGRVQLKHTPARKFFLAEGENTKVLAAWWAGEHKGELANTIQAHLSRLSKKEKKQLREIGVWAPSWISDLLLENPLRYGPKALSTIDPNVASSTND